MTAKIIAIQKVLFPDQPKEWDGLWGAKCKAALEAIVNPPSVLPSITEGPADSVDARSEKNIATLHRKVQPLARQLVKDAAANGINIVITSGTRTYEEQDALFRKGNVTKARGGYSNHNFGLALDVTIFKGAAPVWNSPQYKTVGQLGKALGLEWGGDWKSFVDEPHFQLRPAWASSMSESAMLSELRRRHDTGEDAFA